MSDRHAGFSIFESNDMESLADICAVIMTEYPLSDPFLEEYIVVMNMGMQTFLSQRIAMQNQVETLCSYRQIWQLIFHVYHLVFPQANKRNLYDRDHLTWNIYSKIYSCLPKSHILLQKRSTLDSNEFSSNNSNLPFDSSASIALTDSFGQTSDNRFSSPLERGALVDIYEKLRHYMQEDHYGDKAYELSAKIADIFDQYQIYRPRWIECWNSFSLDDFDRYEFDPKDPNNPINVFIRNECKRFARKNSGADNALYQKRNEARAEEIKATGLNMHEALNKAMQEEVMASPLLSKAEMVQRIFETNIWQMKLWCSLRDNLYLNDDNDVPLQGEAKEWALAHLDRSQVVAALIKELQNKDSFPNMLERVFIFGVGALPRIVLDFFDALSKHCQINLMLLSPCKEYMGDITTLHQKDFKNFVKQIQSSIKSHSKIASRLKKRILSIPLTDFQENNFNAEGERVNGNPLLLSYGKQCSDIQYLLLDRENIPNFIACYTTIGDDSAYDIQEVIFQDRPLSEIRGGTLLNFLQRQLLSIEQKAVRYVIAPQDKSLTIHSCHTRLRELEVLHDTLLQLFNEAKLKGEKLLPRDIVVMVPTINEYASDITAVFGGTYEINDPNYIPFVISDRSEIEANNVVQSLIKLLELSSHRVTASTVVELLNENAIAKRFGLTETDVNDITSWLISCNVYWGLDQEDVADLSTIELPGSFESGLNRMLLGTLVGDTNELACYSEIEGTSAVVLGKFWDFIQALKELRSTFTPSLALEPHQWANQIQEKLIARFFSDDDETMSALFCVNQVISDLREVIYDIKDKPAINLPVFTANLSQGLDAIRNCRPFLREKVNFCSLMPMRAVPFKHVFILGLNDFDFPREERTPSFNMISSREMFERGDRSRNIEDRFLFLEAILSARESIYLSYIGQDPATNTEQNPSILVSELEYYLCDVCCVENGEVDNHLQRENEVLRRIHADETLNAYHRSNFIVSEVIKEQYAQDFCLGSHNKASQTNKTTKATIANTTKSHIIKPKTVATAFTSRMPSFMRNCDVLSNSQKSPEKFIGFGCYPYKNLKEDFSVIELKTLKRFFSAPDEYFLRKRFNIFMQDNNHTKLQDNENFGLPNYQRGILVNNIMSCPSIERASLINYQSNMGLMPYGIFKEKLTADIIETCNSLQKILDEYNLSSFADIKEHPCPKAQWTLAFKDSVCFNENEVNIWELAQKEHEALAKVIADKNVAQSLLKELNLNESQGLILDPVIQANYLDHALIIKVVKAAKELSVKSFFDKNHNKLKLNQYAINGAKDILQVFFECFAYALYDGSMRDIKIVDAHLNTFIFKAYDSMEEICMVFRTLLHYFFIGHIHPIPSLYNTIKNVHFLEDGQLTVEKAKEAFAYAPASQYLFGNLTNVLQDKYLNAFLVEFIDFYLNKIATHVVLESKGKVNSKPKKAKASSSTKKQSTKKTSSTKSTKNSKTTQVSQESIKLIDEVASSAQCSSSLGQTSGEVDSSLNSAVSKKARSKRAPRKSLNELMEENISTSKV